MSGAWGCPDMAEPGIAGNQTIVLAPCAGSCGRDAAYWLDGDPDRHHATGRHPFGLFLLGLMRLRGEGWLREQRGGLACACLSGAVTLDGDTLVHLAWRAEDAAAARAGAQGKDR